MRAGQISMIGSGPKPAVEKEGDRRPGSMNQRREASDYAIIKSPSATAPAEPAPAVSWTARVGRFRSDHPLRHRRHSGRDGHGAELVRLSFARPDGVSVFFQAKLRGRQPCAMPSWATLSASSVATSHCG